MSAPSLVTVGIDVAKDHVDVSMLDARLDTQRFDNDAQGHSALAVALQPLDVALVVMEATGGYEAEMACALQSAGLPVAVTTLILVFDPEPPGLQGTDHENPRVERGFGNRTPVMGEVPSLSAELHKKFCRQLFRLSRGH